ncbi:Cut8 six-helix bundle-domain-containing protein [Phlyctochytrium arcticum]|nr:Cut8 six-helix bundle-domain-containing protein [Phlyctochytrium arcticum]
MMHQRPPSSPHGFGFRANDAALRTSRKRKPSWDADEDSGMNPSAAAAAGPSSSTMSPNGSATPPTMMTGGLGSAMMVQSPSGSTKRFRGGPLDPSLLQRLQALHTSHDQQQASPQQQTQQRQEEQVQQRQQEQVTTQSAVTDSVVVKNAQSEQQAQEQTAQQNQNMRRVLASLSKEQLLNIITTLVQNHPPLTSHLADLIPRPTLSSVASILQESESALNDAFPYSKFGPDRSDYAYNRVRPQAEDLTQLILHYLNHFVQPSSYPDAIQHEYPTIAFSYLHLATTITHRLPVWQSAAYNANRNELYRVLGNHWRAAVGHVGRLVKDEGKVFGAAIVGEWARNLHQHSSEVKGEFGFSDAWTAFGTDLGWLIGLFPSNNPPGHNAFATSVNGSAGAGLNPFAAFPMAAVG